MLGLLALLGSLTVCKIWRRRHRRICPMVVINVYLGRGRVAKPRESISYVHKYMFSAWENNKIIQAQPPPL